MPRPKRARQALPANNTRPSEPAAATTTKNLDDNDDRRGRTRSRARATRSTGTRNSLDEENALRAAQRSRDAALDRLANEDPTFTSGPDDDNTRSSVEMGRRTMATPSARRDTTGLDLADDSVFGDLGDSFADGDVPEAPHSGASSSATLSHFKTRPRSRQSSIIGRNDPTIRPSSRAGNTSGVSSSFNIGVFRRRARQPSILGRSRRARSQTGSVAGSVASSRAGSRAGSVARDSGLESEGELAPEAESTPSKNRRQSRKSQQLAERRRPSPELRRRSTRKRNSDDAAQSESARPSKVSRVEANGGGLVIDSDSELSDVPSPSPPPGRFVRPVTPVNMDEITAPPASSDSEADDDGIWPDIHTLAKKRRRPSVTTPLRNHDNLSDVSTPPSLTHSPNLAAATRGRGAAKKRQRCSKITTADLTSLLPKRSYKRNRDEFDIDSGGGASSSDDDDDDDDDQDEDEDEDEDEDDEPFYEGARSRSRRRKARRPPSRAASRDRGQSRANTVLKPKQTPGSVRRSARAVNKTYRSSEDKENDDGDEDEQHDNSQFQPLPDDTFDESAVVPDVQNAEELKKASQKFKEVDQWELSFEEVAEPPSPQGAR